LVIEIPRPNRKAAAAIFDRYLRCDIPYARNGHDVDSVSTRVDIIQAALSRIYAPNAGNRLATLTFRDGKQSVVTAKDLNRESALKALMDIAAKQLVFLPGDHDGGFFTENGSRFYVDC